MPVTPTASEVLHVLDDVQLFVHEMQRERRILEDRTSMRKIARTDAVTGERSMWWYTELRELDRTLEALDSLISDRKFEVTEIGY